MVKSLVVISRVFKSFEGQCSGRKLFDVFLLSIYFEKDEIVFAASFEFL